MSRMLLALCLFALTACGGADFQTASVDDPNPAEDATPPDAPPPPPQGAGGSSGLIPGTGGAGSSAGASGGSAGQGTGGLDSKGTGGVSSAGGSVSTGGAIVSGTGGIVSTGGAPALPPNCGLPGHPTEPTPSDPNCNAHDCHGDPTCLGCKWQDVAPDCAGVHDGSGAYLDAAWVCPSSAPAAPSCLPPNPGQSTVDPDLVEWCCPLSAAPVKP